LSIFTDAKNLGREIVVIKLDFAKAFDTIEHSSILEILKHMGFDDRWISWMKLIFDSRSSALNFYVKGR
jgi:hypothetical protein